MNFNIPIDQQSNSLFSEKRREGLEKKNQLAVRLKMGKSEIIVKAEKLVQSAMKGNDASHDAAHAFRVRSLALSLATEEDGLSNSPDSMLTVTFFPLSC